MNKHLLLSIFFLLCSFTISELLADGETHATHFVAVNGTDSGDCLDTSLPCQSIKYAIDQAAKTSHVHIATGTYEVDAENVVHFLGDKVPLMGGYTRDDNYKLRSDIENPVTLVGVPLEFRDQLAAKGFKVIADSKELSEARISEIEKFTKTYLRVSTVQ